MREVYSRPTMPVSKDEVPKQELNSQVDLLIGSDVPKALQPKEVSQLSEEAPTLVRWSSVG